MDAPLASLEIGLPHLHRGKVRDLYDAGDGLVLLVASDRLSAFDVVMAEPIPDKGRVLTAMSAFWFRAVGAVCPSHLVSTDLDALPPVARRRELAGRITLCRKVEILPVECIVRGYLSGSAWKEYRVAGTIHGEPAPAGLREADPLPEPRFTPSTKAAAGDHDENITFDRAADLIGRELAGKVRDVCLELYRLGAAHAASSGIIVADTKFELGLLDGEVVLADEVLTPDSSRFWPSDGWEPGHTPPSFDKQPVRDYLDGLDWDKTPPPPPLPADVVTSTRDRYIDAYERITGLTLADWPSPDNPSPA